MRKKNILLVEDDLIERMKFKKIVSSHSESLNIVEVENGLEAYSYLENSDSLPSVVLLDINMPKMNGLEFIKKIKSEKKLKFLPVVFFTTSSNDKDIFKAYDLGCAGYMVKPLKYSDYKTMVGTLVDYWIKNKNYN